MYIVARVRTRERTQPSRREAHLCRGRGRRRRLPPSPLSPALQNRCAVDMHIGLRLAGARWSWPSISAAPRPTTRCVRWRRRARRRTLRWPSCWAPAATTGASGGPTRRATSYGRAPLWAALAPSLARSADSLLAACRRQSARRAPTRAGVRRICSTRGGCASCASTRASRTRGS